MAISVLWTCWASNRTRRAIIRPRVGVFFRFSPITNSLNVEIFFHLLINHRACLRLWLSLLYLSSLIQISISHLHPPSVYSSLLIKRRLNFCLSLFPPLSSLSLAASLYSWVGFVRFLFFLARFHEHTANTLDKSSPLLLLSLFSYTPSPGFGGAIFVSRFVCRFVSPHPGLSWFVSDRFISTPLSPRCGGSDEVVVGWGETFIV